MPDVSATYLSLAGKVTEQDGGWHDMLHQVSSQRIAVKKHIPEVQASVEPLWLASHLLHRILVEFESVFAA